jgi:CheY-like chemotaxis protein
VTGTILIVDDDPVTREGLRAMLERQGYTVGQARSGSEALTYLNLNPAPHLILLDMMMPGMDGWKFLGAFRQTRAWSAIPVLITTAMPVASSEWAASLGAAGLLKKPFEEDDLMTPLRQLCQDAY